MSKSTNTRDELGEEMETMLVRFLHKHDHEPDEITKYVVIDQKEFAPEVAKVIVDLLAKDRQQLIDEILSELPEKDGYVGIYERSIGFKEGSNTAIDQVTAILQKKKLRGEEY